MSAARLGKAADQKAVQHDLTDKMWVVPNSLKQGQAGKSMAWTSLQGMSAETLLASTSQFERASPLFFFYGHPPLQNHS